MLETLWTDTFDINDPLLKMRAKAWDRFSAIGLPHRKMEAFQYLKSVPEFPSLSSDTPDWAGDKKGLIFVDGFLMEKNFEAFSPCVCLSIEKAMKSYGLFLQNRIAKLTEKEKDPFAALNGAFQGRGAFIYVPPNTTMDLPIWQIDTQNGLASPRLHLFVGRSSVVNLVIHSESSQGLAQGLTNGLIDIVADRDAKVYLTDYANGNFSSLRAQAKKGAEIVGVFLGSQLRRSIEVQLAEEESRVELFGLCKLQKTQENHIHALIEHVAPNAFSRQHFKSVVEDASRFSFEGKIYVHPEAQKTQSYQLNNNLILSDEASANAKPNLEIFADDVKASHGATFGRLNEEELFYLQSRGLDPIDARKWLIQGFCQEILDHARRIPNL